MTPNRTSIIFILVVLFLLIRPGIAQEAEELFQSELTEASLGKDSSKVQVLISEHRLWVKPVVNQLISESIHRTMTGNRAAGGLRKEAATLISQTFQNTYGEKSLTIATGYLDSWTMEQMGKKAQADRIFGIATNLRKNGQSEKAIKEYHRALKLYLDIGDIRGEGEVMGGLGVIYWAIDSDTCLAYYLEALRARQSVDDRVLTGNSLNSIGLVYFFHYGDLDSAIEYLLKATEVRGKNGDMLELGNSLAYLAQVYENKGELELALEYYKQAFPINLKAGSMLKSAESKLHSGSILQQMGRYPEALGDLESALEVFSELKDTVYMGDVYTQIAVVYENLGDYDTALEKLNVASELYNQMGEIWGLAGVYNHTGMVLQSAERKQRAVEFYLKSFAIYEEQDDQVNVVILLTNLGAVKFEQGDFLASEAYQQRGLQISRNIEFKAGELPCLINLANSQNRLNQLDAAMANYDLAMELCKELNSPENEWKALVGIAENYKLREDYTQAIEFNEKGLSIIEELRNTIHTNEYKSTYLARERFAFEDVIHMLAELHEAESGKGYDLLAFEYAQRCKSRSFLDQFERPEPSSLNAIQNSGLDRNTVLLEYSLGDSSSCLWVITKDAYKMVRLPNRKILQEQVETFRFAILNPDQDNKTFLEQSGYFLYQQLLEPVSSFLTKRSTLVILPDGILHYVPFEVLVTKEPDLNANISYGKIPYLGKSYPLSYGQSASVVRNTIEKPASIPDPDQKRLVAFGDPEFGTQFKRLEHSGEEVISIAALLPAGSADIYLRERATEENAKKDQMLSGYSNIHFATHGLVDERNPEKSSLVLAQKAGTSEDGFLRAEEISELKLNADLVVLSACQTGLGKMIRGEGMIGLSRSFMYAGAPSVIVSLWSVSDNSTNIFMEKFYENLFRKDLTKAEALHLARISMMKNEEFSHPFFWAPFVLMGNWQ